MRIALAILLGALVMTVPIRPADAAASTNADTIRAFYAHLEAKDIPAFLDLFAEDAVQDMPYAPPGFPARVEGKTEIAKLFAGFPDATNGVAFPGLTIYPTDDPDRLIAEVGGEIEFKGADERYRQRYISIFEFEDGKIMLFREYFNPIPFAEAVGLGRFQPSE